MRALGSAWPLAPLALALLGLASRGCTTQPAAPSSPARAAEAFAPPPWFLAVAQASHGARALAIDPGESVARLTEDGVTREFTVRGSLELGADDSITSLRAQLTPRGGGRDWELVGGLTPSRPSRAPGVRVASLRAKLTGRGALRERTLEASWTALPGNTVRLDAVSAPESVRAAPRLWTGAAPWAEVDDGVLSLRMHATEERNPR